MHISLWKKNAYDLWALRSVLSSAVEDEPQSRFLIGHTLCFCSSPFWDTVGLGKHPVTWCGKGIQ